MSAYAIDYRLKLFSNFTYALERPAGGDQFLQQDDRSVYGLSASHAFDHNLGRFTARSELGLQLRHDRVRVGLFDTVGRSIASTTRDDQVRQTLLGVYGQTSIELTPWLRAVLGARADSTRFTVNSLAQASNSGRAASALVSPKLALVLGPAFKLPRQGPNWRRFGPCAFCTQAIAAEYCAFVQYSS